MGTIHYEHFLRHATVVLRRLLIGTTFRSFSTRACPCCRCSRLILAKVFRRSVSTLFVYRNERSSI